RLTLATIVVAAPFSIAGAVDIDQQIAAIRAVAAEGRGNQEAALAWRELVRQRARALPEILAAFDDANPLAVNYLRSAVATIAQRELENGGSLPTAELEKFVRKTKHDPRSRRLAYELLVGVDSAAPDRIIPEMLHDPGVEFRRDAVARLIDQASKQLSAAEKDEAHRLLAD